jgi:hypothetical protein
MSMKKKSMGYRKTAAFNSLPLTDREAERLQKILPATTVGPGSYNKGASAHRSMKKRIIRNGEMTNFGNRINNTKCNHDQCKNQNGGPSQIFYYRCPGCLKGPYTKLSDHQPRCSRLSTCVCVQAAASRPTVSSTCA